MEGFPAIGHGLGLMWEAPWLVKDDPTPIEPNMYLAVEVLLGHPSIGGAMFEHNGIVGRRRPRGPDHGAQPLVVIVRAPCATVVSASDGNTARRPSPTSLSGAQFTPREHEQSRTA